MVFRRSRGQYLLVRRLLRRSVRDGARGRVIGIGMASVLRIAAVERWETGLALRLRRRGAVHPDWHGVVLRLLDSLVPCGPDLRSKLLLLAAIASSHSRSGAVE